MRKYYDERLKEYVDVGFKVCVSVRFNRELRACLKEKEYQLLVIPYLAEGSSFGNMPLEEFAFRFVSPIILVGPKRPNDYYINDPARLIVDSLDLPSGNIEVLPKPGNLLESSLSISGFYS